MDRQTHADERTSPFPSPAHVDSSRIWRVDLTLTRARLQKRSMRMIVQYLSFFLSLSLSLLPFSFGTTICHFCETGRQIFNAAAAASDRKLGLSLESISPSVHSTTRGIVGSEGVQLLRVATPSLALPFPSRRGLPPFRHQSIHPSVHPQIQIPDSGRLARSLVLPSTLHNT